MAAPQPLSRTHTATPLPALPPPFFTKYNFPSRKEAWGMGEWQVKMENLFLLFFWVCVTHTHFSPHTHTHTHHTLCLMCASVCVFAGPPYPPQPPSSYATRRLQFFILIFISVFLVFPACVVCVSLSLSVCMCVCVFDSCLYFFVAKSLMPPPSNPPLPQTLRQKQVLYSKGERKKNKNK